MNKLRAKRDEFRAGRQRRLLRECESAVHGAGAAKPRRATPRRTHSRTASHATHNTSTNNVQASICSYREGHAVAIGKATATFIGFCGSPCCCRARERGKCVVRETGEKEKKGKRELSRGKGLLLARAWTELTRKQTREFSRPVSRGQSRTETETERERDRE